LLLSIIIPVLNEEALVISCLERLLPLRRRGHEVIVVDGGSDDATRSLAAPRCTRLLRGQRGRAMQMNFGASVASGDVLLFLHVDSRLPGEVEHALGTIFGEATEAWGWFDSEFDGRAAMFRVIAACMNLRARLTRTCTGDQALFASAALFHRAGGFPGIPLMEDIAICSSLGRHSRPRRIALATVTSSRRWETRGVARTIWQMWWLRGRYFFGADPEQLAARYYPGLFDGATSPWRFANARILVFARQPEAGAVKTRLARQIGGESALELHLAMLRRIVRLARQSGLAKPRLWVTGDPANEHFLDLCPAEDIQVQQGAGLGARLRHAAAQELAAEGVDMVLIVGSDSPAMAAGYLHRALAALASGAEVVLGPARDGGYVLIGLAHGLGHGPDHAAQELFAGISWGSDKVLQQTLARLRRLGLRHQLLEPCWDVDEPADLPLLEGLRPALPWSR